MIVLYIDLLSISVLKIQLYRRASAILLVDQSLTADPLSDLALTDQSGGKKLAGHIQCHKNQTGYIPSSSPNGS